MDLIRGHLLLSKVYPHSVVTIGNFDGVHRGHRAIIQLALQKARARSGTAIAYTFRPHPQIALHPELNVPLLNTYDEKLELLAATGLDVTIEEPFSREFSTLGPEQFFTDVLLRRLNAELIVVGYDFGFGKGREGHLEGLERWCRQSGVELEVVRPQRAEDEVVSSSRIRQHIMAGEVEPATQLLGREFYYRGVVVKGEGRGHKIGFPTANLKLENKIVPPYGVYATWAVQGARRWPSVTNIGVRPTFHDPAVEIPALIETHLIDETIDLYGSQLEVRFVKRLRSERKFAGIDELKKQIALDVELARQTLRA